MLRGALLLIALCVCARAQRPVDADCPELKALCPSSEELTELACAISLPPGRLNSVCERSLRRLVTDLLSDGSGTGTLRKMAESRCGRETFASCASQPSSAYLSCIISLKADLSTASCADFQSKMKLLAFDDLRLAPGLLDACRGRAASLDCDEAAPLPCLQLHLDSVGIDCRREILHLSELQNDNFKLDKQLYASCTEDRMRFCPEVVPESGSVYKCLMLHKTDRDMSPQCQDHLSRRQKLIAQDYKVSKGLSRSCRDDIRNHHCRKRVSDDKDIRLAQILICLEGALKNNSKISPQCRAEMIDHRKMLLEDYRLSPEIMHDCAGDIDRFCSPIKIGGKTIHCLMEHARQKRRNLRVEAVCRRALENLVKETDAGEDWRVDPVLRQACKPVVDAACREVSGGEGRVMSCLVEKIGTTFMTVECETAVVQIQYFVARDFKLDPQLYNSCKDDAVRFCHAKHTWNDDEGQMDPERGPLILPCLYRYAYTSETNLRLTPPCLQEVRRVMKQRAIDVDLQPEIEEVCLDSLAVLCVDKTAKGEELLCLQKNLESLPDKCRNAVSNFTEAQAGHVELNPVIMKNCRRVMEHSCSSILRDGKDEGDVMDCLISHKNDPDVKQDVKCRAAIEHFQLISLKDYHFTHRFKEACRLHVMRYCPQAKTKNEVIYCLSEIIRNDTIDGNKHSIPKDCRQQLRTQLFQQKENIDYDPRLAAACSNDLKMYCSNVEHGGAQALECLQNEKRKLSQPCQNALFAVKKQVFADNAIDYNLITTCNSMISMFCHDTNPSKILDCLKIHKEKITFDEKCKLVVIHRMIDQNTDYRFNPALQTACKPDMKKFCAMIIATEPQDKSLQGKVISCLKVKFRESRLSNNCEHQVASILREQALNYHLDPLLSTLCHTEIETICKPSDNSDTTSNGEVEECLKQAFLQRKIPTEECRTEIASLIGEARADIQADPLLQRSCSIDLLKWCNHLEQGNGRHIKCLQTVMNDETKELEDDCKSQLTKRMEMFKSAAVIMVPEDFQDLYDQVVTSPAKKYFLITFFTFVGMVFIAGLYCGRASHKHRYTKMK